MVIINGTLTKGLPHPESRQKQRKHATFQQEETLFRCKKECPNYGKAIEGGMVEHCCLQYHRVECCLVQSTGTALVRDGNLHVGFGFARFRPSWPIFIQVLSVQKARLKKKKKRYQSLSNLMLYQKHCHYLGTTLEDCFKNSNLVR